MKSKKPAKSIVAIMLIFYFIISFSFNNKNMRSYAANPTITVSSVSGNVGDLVDVTISLSNNPGIIVMQLNVSYPSNLKLVGAKDANIFGDYTHSQSLEQNPFILYWHNDVATQNYTVNGTIMTLTFQILSGDAGQNNEIKVSYNHDGGYIFNFDLQSVQFEIVQGNVSILEGGNVTPLPEDSIPTYNPSSSADPNSTQNPNSNNNPNPTSKNNGSDNGIKSNDLSTAIIISFIVLVITAVVIFLFKRSKNNKK